jgi:hypothetical protein
LQPDPAAKAGTSYQIMRCHGTFHREESRPSDATRAEIEVTMATTRDQRQIVETPTEARQGEPGPSVAALLAISTGLAILILAVIWFVFFRT